MTSFVCCAPRHPQAKQLARLLRDYNIESHVNVIPWNPVDESEYERPSRNRAYAFQRVLQVLGNSVLPADKIATL